MTIVDWTRYPSFSEKEMKCSYSAECHMDPDFMEKLQRLRYLFGKPMVVTSGYRHPNHPKEVGKARKGAHTHGKAADIAVSGEDAYRLVKLAMEVGFTGIGINQKGSSGRFIHLDTMTMDEGFPRPTIYSY